MNENDLKNIINTYSVENKLEYSLSISKEFDEIHINPNVLFPSASLVKLFILGAIIDNINKGEFEYHRYYTISKKDYVWGSGLIKYCNGKLKLKLKDLIYLMMAYSDNIATNKIIELLTIKKIQIFINNIGAINTEIMVPMMASKEKHGKKTNVTTSKDICTFYKYIIQRVPNSTLTHVKTSTECLKIMKISACTQKNTFAFMISMLNLKLIINAIKNNLRYIHKYFKASLNTNSKRLCSKIPQSIVLGAKSGIGKLLFHDSCIVKKDNTIIVLIFKGVSANFSEPNSKIFNKTKNFSAELGRKIVFNN